MAWGSPSDKPLSDPMMVVSLTHICVTRPQLIDVQTFGIRKEIYRFKIEVDMTDFMNVYYKYSSNPDHGAENCNIHLDHLQLLREICWVNYCKLQMPITHDIHCQ